MGRGGGREAWPVGEMCLGKSNALVVGQGLALLDRSRWVAVFICL